MTDQRTVPPEPGPGEDARDSSAQGPESDDGRADAVLGEGGIAVWLTPAGIMRVRLPESAAVTGAQAESVAGLVRELARGRRHPLLLDLTGAASVSRGARNVYTHARTVSAYALLGKTPVDRVLAHYFLAGKPALVPAEFFTSEAAALSWLDLHARS